MLDLTFGQRNEDRKFVPQMIPWSPATKETGTPWASERIACVAPVEEESQGCPKLIEMHHGPKKNDMND